MTSASELRSGKTHRDENFPVASWIIHPRHRALILSFYNFVRTADDIADHATLNEKDKLGYLDLLEAELLGKGDSQPEAVNLRRALAERSMPPRHALDVLIAFRMDVTKLRYENWDEVIHYCRYSAMPVGRFMLYVHGESTSTWPNCSRTASVAWQARSRAARWDGGPCPNRRPGHDARGGGSEHQLRDIRVRQFVLRGDAHPAARAARGDVPDLQFLPAGRRHRRFRWSAVWAASRAAAMARRYRGAVSGPSAPAAPPLCRLGSAVLFKSRGVPRPRRPHAHRVPPQPLPT